MTCRRARHVPGEEPCSKVRLGHTGYVRGEAIRQTGDGDQLAARVELFGGLKVWHGDVPLPLVGQRQLCLLAVLLLNHGRTVSADELAEWAWPSIPPDTVGRQIPNYLSGLRRGLRPVSELIRLESRRPGYSALVDPELLDVARFSALIRSGRDALAGHEPEVAADRLRAASALWRGHPLDGLETPYLTRQAQRLAAERRDASLLLAGIELRKGDSTEAVALLRELASQYPDDDAVTTLLVRALTGAGQGTEAADLASRAERSLIAQGRTPPTALRRAHSDALAGRSSTATASTIDTPRQLPADTGAFTGRERELLEVVRLAKQANAGHSPGTVLICAVDGMAGVGKTALAVHAGHRLVDLFPGGQLVVDLHGYTPNATPRDPAEALDVLLRTLGVPTAQIPENLDGRAALFRQRLAGTRTLILLDNAADEAQVRPLLPAEDHCLVLVTSRRRLKALDEAHLIPLDVLPVADASALFRQVAGPARVPANDPLLDELFELCGRLPLALRIAAAILRNRPSWPLSRLVNTLRSKPSALVALSDGSRALSAVFDLSYQSLDPRLQDAYRRLGRSPAPDVDAYAAAAAFEKTPAEADDLLQDLVDNSLLVEHEPGRYRLHDLIRQHARTLAGIERHDAAEEDRLLTYYGHVAQVANARMARQTRPLPGPAVPYSLPDMDTPEDAFAWLRTERANLEACLHHATTTDRPKHVIALTIGLMEMLRLDGPWVGSARLAEAAVRTAQLVDDRSARAYLLTDLAALRRLVGDYPDAISLLTEADAEHRLLDDEIGSANALTELCIVHRLTGDSASATGYAERALDRFRTLHDRRGEANVLNEIGATRLITGEFSAAGEAYARALALHRDLGQRRGQALSLTNLALVHRQTGDYPAALRALVTAREVFEQLGDRRGQAYALTDLGILRRLTDDPTGAESALTAALDLYRGLGERYGQAIALTELGSTRRAQGEFAQAARDISHALELFRKLGDRGSEACALNHYGAVLAALNDLPQATRTYQNALSLAREVSQPDDEALALEGLAECSISAGHAEDAVTHLHQALEIFQRLGMRTHTKRVESRLAELPADP